MKANTHTISDNLGSYFILQLLCSTCCLDYNLCENSSIITPSSKLFSEKRQDDTSLKTAIHLLLGCPGGNYWDQQALRDEHDQDGDGLIFHSEYLIERFADLSKSGRVTWDHWMSMINSVNVMSSMVCVEFLLYTVCLCVPQWLVEPGGVCEGLFAIYNTYEGFSSCTTFPAWIGECILFCENSW